MSKTKLVVVVVVAVFFFLFVCFFVLGQILDVELGWQTVRKRKWNTNISVKIK